MNPFSSASPLQPSGPVDIYRRIHKALRACICDTLARIGRLDSSDAQEVSAVLAQVRSMVAFCTSHLAHENRFVHTAMEARFPGSSKSAGDEHVHHNFACKKIAALADIAEQSRAAERVALVNQLYQYVALFLADNLVHMNAEETKNNTLLWATHSDEELIEIERAIVASLTPDESALSMRWMLPALTPVERLQLLGQMRGAMPREAFDILLATLKPLLAAGDWNKLTDGLYARPEARLAA